MRVSEIMTEAAVTDRADDTMAEAARKMWEQQTGSLIVMEGEEPDQETARALDITLVLYADHTLNASTFTARVIASTLSDMHSAITGAIAALKGPLHGGANEEAMKMLEEIGDPSKAEAYVKDRLGRKQKIMGFGHRVYKTEDPRATHLRRLSKELGQCIGIVNGKELGLNAKTLADELRRRIKRRNHRLPEIGSFNQAVRAIVPFPGVDHDRRMLIKILQLTFGHKA